MNILKTKKKWSYKKKYGERKKERKKERRNLITKTKQSKKAKWIKKVLKNECWDR